MTLDFSGPLLPLPEEAVDEVGEPAPSELVDAPVVAPSSGAGRLDLDLGELADSAASKPIHDAWTADRHRRSTPPPVPGLLLCPPRPSRSSRPPAPPARDFADGPLALDPRGGALDLVEQSRPLAADLDLASEMEERYALGDFTGALRAAELILGRRPDDPDAHRFAKSSRQRLEQLYSSRLGALGRVPTVALPDRNIRWLGLDHRAGFLLSRIDGHHSLEEILDVSGMPRLEALKTLCELLDLKAIRIEG